MENLRELKGKTFFRLESNYVSIFQDLTGLSLGGLISLITFEENKESLNTVAYNFNFEYIEIGFEDTHTLSLRLQEGIDKPSNFQYSFTDNGVKLKNLKKYFKVLNGNRIQDNHLLFEFESGEQMFLRPLGATPEVWLYFDKNSIQTIINQDGLVAEEIF